MARKRFTVEQIIGLLREADVKLSQGRQIGQTCRDVLQHRRHGPAEGHKKGRTLALNVIHVPAAGHRSEREGYMP